MVGGQRVAVGMDVREERRARVRDPVAVEVEPPDLELVVAARRPASELLMSTAGDFTTSFPFREEIAPKLRLPACASKRSPRSRA